jgi:syndecan 1
MDPIESTHAARSDGSSDESSKEAKSASPTGPLSDGDGEGKAADVKPADEKPADVKPAPPPPPPGPPPPAHRARTSMDGAHARMRREMSCPTFFPEPEQRIPPPPPPAPPSKPGPAVLPPRTAGDDDGKPVTDVFTGDLEAIWSHLQFGRAYHHLAIVHMRSFGAMGGTETRGAHGASQQRYGGRKGGGGAVGFQPAAEQGRRRPRRARQERQLGRGRRG